MIKKLLERFKRVFTVAEWKREAQDAMRKKEFVIESLDELHRIEKAEAAGQERVLTRGQNQYPNQQDMGIGYHGIGYQNQAIAQRRVDDRKRDKERSSEKSLADLMNAIRQQQVAQQ